MSSSVGVHVVHPAGPYHIYRCWGTARRRGIAWRLLDWLTRGLFWLDVLLYIGQTARVPVVRLGEHLAGQRWAGEVRTWEVDDRAWPTEAAVLRAERHAIRTERPRYNVAHNGGRTVGVRLRGPRARRRGRAGRRLLIAAAAWLVLALLLPSTMPTWLVAGVVLAAASTGRR